MKKRESLVDKMVGRLSEKVVSAVSRAIPKEADQDKVNSFYLPAADPENPGFADVRGEYYHKMARAIWLKCTDCTNGKVAVSNFGTLIPRCERVSCPLHPYSGETFMGEVRRGSAGDDSEGSARPVDAWEGKRKTRTRTAVRKAADSVDNGTGGPGVSPGPGPKEDSGGAGSPEAGKPRASRRRAAGGDKLSGGGDSAPKKPRRTKTKGGTE